MGFESAADRASFFVDDAVSVSWSVDGVPAASFLANWDSGTIAQNMTSGPPAMNRRGTLSLPAASLPPGAEDDGAVNEVTVDGAIFTTKSIEPDGTGMMIVRLEAVDP